MSYSSEVLADSPAGYWRLGEASGATMTDSSGNGRNGTYTAATYGVSGATTDGDTAITFGSSTSIGSVAYGSWMNAIDLSIEFWVKTTTTSVRVAVHRDPGSNRCWQTQVTAAGKAAWITVAGGNPSITSSASVNDGNWHHVVFTIRTSGSGAEYNVYIDGVLDTTTTPTGTDIPTPTATGIDIGGRGGTNFAGSIDEVAFYPGTLLSSTRVAAHYAAARATFLNVGQATETDSALAATVQSGAVSISVGQATETDSALTATVKVGVVLTLGQATETDSALAATVVEGLIVPTGQAQETEAALAATVLAGSLIAAGLATETDAALAAATAVTIAVGMAQEADSALGASAVASVTLGLATETDTAIGVTVIGGDEGLVIEVGFATETNLALSATLTFDYGTTDTDNTDDGVFLGDGLAEIVWEPDIVAPPTGLAEVRTVANVIDTAPGPVTAYTAAVARTESTTAPRLRVLVNNRDMTFVDDVPTVVDKLTFIDPLLYGSGQITFPGINAQFPHALGDLRDYFMFARVVVQLVIDGDPAEIVDADYYKGFVTRVDAEGTDFVLTLGGQAAGRLSGIEVRPPVYRRKQDVEHILVDTLRDARVRAKKHDGTSGVSLIRRGGSDGLSIFNETLAVWAGAKDSPITFTPNAQGVYRKTTKDLETVNFTAYLDSSLISQSLSQDFMEQPTRVYAQGWTAAGELVTNIKNPGMTQGDAPDFPNDDNTPMMLGDIDATTDSGAGVTSVQQQLAIQNFYDYDDGLPGVYGQAVEDAVAAFQTFAKLNVTGEVGPNTWDRLFNLDKIGYSLDDAREYPMWEDPRVSKWVRSGNGSKVAPNPDFDPHVQPVDLSIDVGGPFGKGEIRKFAASKGAPDGGVWVGQLTLRSGLVSGEHNPGDPFTTADVADRREVKPNHNIWLPTFAGGLLVHVTGVDHGPEESTALVSTHPATTVETWAAIERLREAKSNPGRQWSGHTRKSQVRNDLGPQWDTSSGWLAVKKELTGGEWTEIMVPAGQAGLVKRIRCQLQTPNKFAVLLTQKPVSLGALNSRARISSPLSTPSGRPWYEQEDIFNWLEGRGYLQAWGTHKQACGYDPSRENDDEGATGSSVTGLFVEEAGFDYETGAEPVLYLYIWVGANNALMPGRILRNQRTTDF